MTPTMKEAELFAIPVPEKTESYSPVSHEHIIGEIQDVIGMTKMTIKSRHYQASAKGDVVMGYIDLDADSDTFRYRIAFQNSYNKTKPVAFVGGTSVILCSNGMIVGDTKFVRRHTGEVAMELSEKIHEVVDELQADLEKAERHAEQMKLVELNPTTTAELCGRLLMEQEIISSSQLSIIRQQLKNPDHAVFADSNLWSLYNHATHALKTTHPYSYLDAYTRLHEFVENEYVLK